MSDRPFIFWKCAASLYGRIAAADGSSKWITSAEARADGHRLRAECGAVMVGSGTQQADDPQLAVRDAEVTRADVVRLPRVDAGLNLDVLPIEVVDVR